MMMWSLMFVFIFTILAEGGGERGTVSKRIARQLSFNGINSKVADLLEKTIIKNCVSNGLSDQGVENLKKIYEEMNTCVGSTGLFLFSKNEFIDSIEKCGRRSIDDTKSCLADSQKWLPEFILDLTKSHINFMYDHRKIIQLDLPVCMMKFQELEGQMAYKQCLDSMKGQVFTMEEIPSSKQEFCSKFLRGSKCMTKIIRDQCDITSNILKLVNNFDSANSKPCEVP